jgi:hypothetical protein
MMTPKAAAALASRLPRHARNYCRVVASPSAPPSMVSRSSRTYARYGGHSASGEVQGAPTIKVRRVVQPPSGPRAGVPKTDGWK